MFHAVLGIVMTVPSAFIRVSFCRVHGGSVEMRATVNFGSCKSYSLIYYNQHHVATKQQQKGFEQCFHAVLVNDCLSPSIVSVKRPDLVTHLLVYGFAELDEQILWWRRHHLFVFRQI